MNRITRKVRTTRHIPVTTLNAGGYDSVFLDGPPPATDSTQFWFVPGTDNDTEDNTSTAILLNADPGAHARACKALHDLDKAIHDMIQALYIS